MAATLQELLNSKPAIEIAARVAKDDLDRLRTFIRAMLALQREDDAKPDFIVNETAK